jgi:hypothetical protein
MPHIADSSTDTWNLELAAKYLDKTFNLFDEKALRRPPSSAIRDWIGVEIQTRFDSSDDKKNSATNSTEHKQGEAALKDETE